MSISEYDADVPRLATTADVFNAIAEPQRRRLLDLLAGGPRAVADLAAALHQPQPLVSKHLRVLRTVDLVRSRQDGRQRIYALHPQGLRHVLAWVQGFERFWASDPARLDEYLAELQHREVGGDLV